MTPHPYVPCSKPSFSRLKLSGKGHVTISVSTARDITATELIIYHTWDFFSFQDRVTLSRLSPTYIAYASLHYDATHETPSTLRSKLNHIPVAFHDTLISPIRARNMCKVLLLFHFDFGNLVRWLGGDYTYDHIDHDSIKETFVTLRSVKQGDLYPKHNFDRVLRLFLHGVPDNAAYECTIKDVLARNFYNSHAGSQSYLTSMLSKIVDDVNSHFMIAFPRWIWPFLYGLFLSPLGYVQKKRKTPTVVDPTHLVNGDNGTGALNSYLDKSDPMQVPLVFYQSAQIRH